MLPWLLNGFGTEVKASSLCLQRVSRLCSTCDSLSVQGSDYYNEVECSAEGKGAAQVCRNTKYVKKVGSAGGAAAPRPASRTGAVDLSQHADRQTRGSKESIVVPSTLDDSADFYEEDGGEL